MACPLLRAVTERLSLLDRWPYWVSGIQSSLVAAHAIANSLSFMPDMRTNCLHVDLPIRILHGTIFHDRTQRRANIHVHGHGHIFLRIHGVHQWDFLGSAE
jgi:hypothetical protein